MDKFRDRIREFQEKIKQTVYIQRPEIQINSTKDQPKPLPPLAILPPHISPPMIPVSQVEMTPQTIEESQQESQQTEQIIIEPPEPINLLIYLVAFGEFDRRLSRLLIDSIRKAGFDDEIILLCDSDIKSDKSTNIDIRDFDILKVNIRHKLYNQRSDCIYDYLLARTCPQLFIDINKYSHIMYLDNDILVYNLGFMKLLDDNLYFQMDKMSIKGNIHKHHWCYNRGFISTQRNRAGACSGIIIVPRKHYIFFEQWRETYLEALEKLPRNQKIINQPSLNYLLMFSHFQFNNHWRYKLIPLYKPGEQSVGKCHRKIKENFAVHYWSKHYREMRNDYKRYIREPDPYIFNEVGFGDRWVFLSWALCLSVNTKSTIRVFVKNQKQKDALTKLIPFFDTAGKVDIKIHFGEKAKPMVCKPGKGTLWCTRSRSKTKLTWKPNNSKIVCYQYDGRAHASKKNPPIEDIQRLMNFLPDYNFVKLGLPMSDLETIETVINSELFIGVDSGMAHLCLSTGVPCFIIEYNWPLYAYNPDEKKLFVHCKGTEDAINNVNKYLENRNKYQDANIIYTVEKFLEEKNQPISIVKKADEPLSEIPPELPSPPEPPFRSLKNKK